MYELHMRIEEQRSFQEQGGTNENPSTVCIWNKVFVVHIVFKRHYLRYTKCPWVHYSVCIVTKISIVLYDAKWIIEGRRTHERASHYRILALTVLVALTECPLRELNIFGKGLDFHIDLFIYSVLKSSPYACLWLVNKPCQRAENPLIFAHQVRTFFPSLLFCFSLWKSIPLTAIYQ